MINNPVLAGGRNRRPCWDSYPPGSVSARFVGDSGPSTAAGTGRGEDTLRVDEVLRGDRVKARHFYARIGITVEMFRYGVPASENFSESRVLRDLTEGPADAGSEPRARGVAPRTSVTIAVKRETW